MKAAGVVDRKIDRATGCGFFPLDHPIVPDGSSDPGDCCRDPRDESADSGDERPDPLTRRQNCVSESCSVPIRAPEQRDATRFHANEPRERRM